MKKRRLTRSLFGVAMSTVLIGAQMMPAFAEPFEGGNVLDFADQSYIVPTSYKIALNPNGYNIVTKYVEVAEDATYSEGTFYYILDNGVYRDAIASDFTDTQGTISLTEGTTYYTAVKSAEQVISFNYGMVNMGTEAQDVTVELTASYDKPQTEDATKDIVFVDSVAKTQAKTAQNENGAEKGEYKMYLALAPAATVDPEGTAKPITTIDDSYTKANTFVTNKPYFVEQEPYVEAGTQPTSEDFEDGEYYLKGNDDSYTKAEEFEDDTTYYVKQEPFAAASPAPNSATFVKKDYYEKTDEIGTEVEAKQLSDVIMTKNTTSVSVFESKEGTQDKKKAGSKIAFRLSAAEFGIKANERIDFTTTQAQLEDKVIRTQRGGAAAFTIVGAINVDADWTAAETKKIDFTPSYEWSAVDDTIAKAAGYNQIETVPDAYTVTFNANYGQSPATATESVNAGSSPVGTGDDVVALKTREGYTFIGWAETNNATEAATLSNITINADKTLYAVWKEDLTVTFKDGNTTISTTKVPYNTAVDEPETDPTKDDANGKKYTFDGWYADGEFETVFDFEDTLTENTSIYAKWNEQTIGTAIIYTSSNNTKYLALHKANDAAFDANSQITSVIVNGKNVTAKATVLGGYVAITAGDLTTAGVTLTQGTKLIVSYTVSGVEYYAEITL